MKSNPAPLTFMIERLVFLKVGFGATGLIVVVIVRMLVLWPGFFNSK